MGHNGRSYKYELSTASGDKYTFIAMDACTNMGLKRPYNFYGNLYEVVLIGFKPLLSNQAFN
jgi:hypothetical protein